MPTRDGYDLRDDLNRAGVHVVVVHGDQLHWRCDPSAVIFPMSLDLL